MPGITALMRWLITGKAGGKCESSTVSIKKWKMVPELHDQEHDQADVSYRHYSEDQGEHFGERCFFCRSVSTYCLSATTALKPRKKAYSSLTSLLSVTWDQ